MEQRAHNMYINSDGVDQSPAQHEDHPHHELCNPILPTLLWSKSWGFEFSCRC